MSQDTELRSALVELRIAWEKKAKTLDAMKAGLPPGDDAEKRLSQKAGVYRSLALDLKRTVNDHPPTTEDE